MSRSAREWVITLAAAAAAGIWSIHDRVGGVAGVAIAAVAGACAALALCLLVELPRNPS